MAELDFIYSILETKLRLKNPRTKQVQDSLYKKDLVKQNPALITNNFVLLGLSKKSFIEQTDFVLELRMHNYHIIEATYLTEESKNDNLFNLESFLPIDKNNTEFKLFYKASNLSITHNGQLLNNKLTPS